MNKTDPYCWHCRKIEQAFEDDNASSVTKNKIDEKNQFAD